MTKQALALLHSSSQQQALHWILRSLLPDSRAAIGPASAALLPGSAAAVGEPLFPD